MLVALSVCKTAISLVAIDQNCAMRQRRFSEVAAPFVGQALASANHDPALNRRIMRN